MTPKSKLFQAGFSAALAIALIVQASPVRAEVVTLVCQNELQGGGSFTLRVDYGRKIVDMPIDAELSNPVGTAFFSAAAEITEGTVHWGWDAAVKKSSGKSGFRGSLNRLSGQGNYSLMDNRGFMEQMSGPCRRATQKF